MFQWAAWNKSKYPELSLLHAIPNGGYRPITTAARLKAEGVRAGVPDICLPVARQGYNGLYIELKAPKGRVQANQREWLQDLSEQGYKAVVAYGFEEARTVIEDYLREGVNI
ncbi:MAG: VRR-NUC domain-containing protein [Oscillospiraceae bacterium]|nr:VRR-NUC domain-containing protein [Oscillospiraceae bacterium]